VDRYGPVGCDAGRDRTSACLGAKTAKEAGPPRWNGTSLCQPLENAPALSSIGCSQQLLFAIGRKAVVDIYHNRANLIRQKITLAEMRASGRARGP
jgi:hypothetical protein